MLVRQRIVRKQNCWIECLGNAIVVNFEEALDQSHIDSRLQFVQGAPQWVKAVPKGSASEKWPINPHRLMSSHECNTLGCQDCTSLDSHRDFLLTVSEGLWSEEVLAPLAIDQLSDIFDKECVSGFHVHGKVDGLRRRKPELQMIQQDRNTDVSGVLVVTQQKGLLMDPLKLKPDTRMRNTALRPGRRREVKTDIKGHSVPLVLDKLTKPPD